jgi:hypothetical protein
MDYQETNKTAQDSHPQRLLTEREALEILNCSRSKLATDRMNGLGPSFVRIGSAIRYTMADLEAYIQQNRVER